MRQICPRCNNWVAGTPHISMQDKLGKAAIRKGSAQMIGGAVGLVFGPLGSFAGSVVGSVIADSYSGKIIQTNMILSVPNVGINGRRKTTKQPSSCWMET